MMTVAELIQKLSAFPADAPVVVRAHDEFGYQDVVELTTEMAHKRRHHEHDVPRPDYVEAGSEHAEVDPIALVLIDF